MNIKQLICIAACGMICSNASAKHNITSFREILITKGDSVVLGNTVYTEPDIYYQPTSDNGMEAIRVSVAPAEKSAAITQPYLNINTPNSININWKTRCKPSNAIIRYGKSPSKLHATSNATVSTILIPDSYCWNSVTLSDLRPDTEYYYQLINDDYNSKIYRFRTAPAPKAKQPVRILLIGDHQRNDRSDYEWLLNAAQQTVAKKYGKKQLNDGIHMLMNVGDQVDRGYIPLYETVHLYKSRSVSPTLPIMTVVGNHECKQDPELNIYNAHYSNYGNIEYHGIKSGTANYYAYQLGCVLFIAINSDQPTDEQKTWIRRIIDAASTDNSVDFIVSAQHRPLYAEQWTNDVSAWMLNEIMPILSSTPKHVLNYSGHHHLYARGQMTDQPVYHIISGGGVGTSAKGYEQLWGKTPDNLDLKEVQKTLDHWTYQIIEFDPKKKLMTAECYSIGNSRLALDNELVDSFTRSLNSKSHIPLPGLSEYPIQSSDTLFTFTQKGSVSGLHSAQYQISAYPDFHDTIINELITAENYYGVDSDFRPLDLNKDIDLTSFTFNYSILPEGNYYIRVRNRNKNLDWSEFSTPVSFTVSHNTAPGN